MSTHPTTIADLAAAGWTPGTGRSGYRSHSIEIGPYEIAVYSDGAGVYLERTVDANLIPEADACILASKIAALLRGEHEIVAAERDAARTEAKTLRAHLCVETEARRRAIAALASALIVDPNMVDANHLIEAASVAAGHIKAGTETVNRLDLTVSKLEADLSKAEALFTEICVDLQQQIRATHAMFDEADVEECLGILADRAKALAVDRGRATNALEAVTKERDAARAELNRANTAALKAAASAPTYHHAVGQLRAYLSQRTGVDHTGADIVTAVVRELQGCGETARALQERLDLAEKRVTRAEDIAIEQLRHRLRGT